MEDAHCVHLTVGQHPRASFFGIFDGHSGALCSRYIAEKLPVNFSKATNLEDKQQLRQIVLQTDEDFLTAIEFRAKDDGSAAIFSVSLYDDQTKSYKTINGNVGDSRTVLARKEGNGYTTVACTFDHKPTDDAERRRIENAGGSVQLSRVDGQLALSRAFGDRMLKVPMTPDFPRENRKVTSDPDFIEQSAKTGDFLLMACDGIYEGDIFTRESVIQWVAEKMKEFPTDPAMVCAKLLDECLMRGSRDNMSAMIILFENGTEYLQEKTQYIPGPWHNGENDHKFQDAYTADARAAGYELPEALKLYEDMKAKEEEARNKPPAAANDANTNNNTTTSTSTTSTTSTSNNINMNTNNGSENTKSDG